VECAYGSIMSSLDKKQWRNAQALTDFQQSLSALTFFMDIPQQTCRVERKQYRCYQEAMIINYCRPFTQSKGLPKLSLKSVLKNTSAEETALHNFLMIERNKVVAHTDVDRMRMLLTSFEVSDGLHFPHIVEDEGFALIGKENQLEVWLHKLIAHLAEELWLLMQKQEPGVEFRQDWLHSTLSTVNQTEGQP
jgi:hypothetical protein